jgi:hypothetical protein
MNGYAIKHYLEKKGTESGQPSNINEKKFL